MPRMEARSEDRGEGTQSAEIHRAQGCRQSVRGGGCCSSGRKHRMRGGDSRKYLTSSMLSGQTYILEKKMVVF